MIAIEHVSKSFDGTLVVDDISLTVEAGEIAVIVGTSGSGKTTLLRMINRLIEPTSGSVKIDGKRFFTPMLLVIVAIGFVDLIFAVDSIPAIFGITQSPFIVFKKRKNCRPTTT